jgi:hypothetical protein
VRRMLSHASAGYLGSQRRSNRATGEPQIGPHEGCARRKSSSSLSAPRTPRPTTPTGTGIQEGANVTPKPASQRSRASACNVLGGVAAGALRRDALVSRTASERAAVMVRERSTVSRAEPRSVAERARISPMISRVWLAGSSVSTTEHRAHSDREGSVGAGGICARVSQQSVAEKSIRPAVRVAMVPAGSPVGSTAASGFAASTRPPFRPASLSGPPLVGTSEPPLAVRPYHLESRRRRPRTRRTAGVGAGGGS